MKLDNAEIREGIEALFDEMNDLIDNIIEIKKVIKSNFQYVRIAMPALYSLIERIAYLRYWPEPSSGKRVKKLLLNYSDVVEELKKIDIVFLYQWNTIQHDNNKKLENFSNNIHPKIKDILIAIYKHEKNINIQMPSNKRFISKKDLYQQLISQDKSINFKDSLLDRFSCCEVIYQFGRCSMVHEGDPSARGFISHEYLISLLHQIINNMKSEYLR